MNPDKQLQKQSMPAVPDPETLTLRDQFAMAALAAVDESYNTPKQAADVAYTIADAMLERRKL